MSNGDEIRKDISNRGETPDIVTVSQNNIQIEQPLKQSSETELEVPSQRSENQMKDSIKNQNLNNEKNTDVSKDLSEKYRLIALYTSDFIAFTTFDINPIFTYVSPSHKKFLGYDEEDLLGKSGFDFIHEDDRQLMMEKLLSYFEAKTNGVLSEDMVKNPPKLDFRFRDKSGQWHYMHCTVNITNDELLLISKDVTEQKNSESKIKDNEEKLYAIIQGLSIAAFVLGRDHRIIYWNKALEELSGIHAGEVIGTSNHWRAFYSEKRPCMADILIDGNVDEIKIWYIGKFIKSSLLDESFEATDFFPNLGADGRWLRFTATIIRNKNGELIGVLETLEDISQRKWAEKELQESEKKFKSIFDNANDGFISVDAESRRFFNANRKMIEMLGYESEEEIRNLTVSDIHPEKELPYILGEFEKHAKAEISRSDCMPVKRKDGSIFFASISSSLLKVADKTYLSCIFIDITERKKQEEALKKSEEKFVKAYKSSPVAICITRIDDGKFIEVNESFVSLSGYNRTDLLAESAINLKIWANSEDRKKVVEQLSKTGSVHDQEYRFRMKGGNEIFARYSAELIDVNDEQCVLSVLVDITERKKMEESLRESEEKYRNLVENTQDVIMVTDLAGRVSYMSPACFNVLGYNPNDLIGTILEIFYPDDVEKAHTALSKSLQGISGSNLDYRIRTKNGEIRWISHSWSPIFAEGNKLKFIVSVIRNITESKISEQNLKAKIEELEKYKKITVNREMKMVDLKNEINELHKKLNQKPKYPSV
jgi:PAS domain S-box-containing protein